ncbi:Putative DNA-binding protein ESCAROLA [Apostasia shenzhenica]|uniref:AT-hook motif nuclear-localized protein n=1 Tax=Apostasia shenzhenica TaxID=1088818 RepID=A0A2I0BH18_9ASPA|nr:Putative DNA-binding protein ESCAROLA [Apostasia shenzhenica]
MEVRPEPGIMPDRDLFSISLPKSPTSTPSPVVQNTPMTSFSTDGTAAYRPGSGGPAAASYPGGGGQLPSPQGMNVNAMERTKRKRGRPRKYAPDGTAVIGTSSSAPAVSPGAATVAGSSTGFSLSYASTTKPLHQKSSSHMAGIKKGRGRPPGSSKKHQMFAFGSGGIGFTPHVITVKAGEDVSSKIMSFSHHGPRAVCILSANGAISNVTLRQPATSGGTVTYEGRFEILSLSGSFMQSAGQRSRSGGLSVSLAGPDGRVMGGGVAGLLIAASPVQVVVGSFIADGGRKEPHLTGGEITGPASPASRGTLSDSSGGGGPSFPLNKGTNGDKVDGNNGNGNQQSLSSMPWK